eukprot:TRINITY_DN6827_c0_g1_i5.p1 TRINITY_DN6827_c0_g1~~TRINITY_DN6827_c0_g1_i5.p1  ORF type:complete len:195 (-),score=62.50 TRINITY_DN6827_c0_g1_i5:937-1497(-)
MIRRPPRSTPLYSSAASDVYKRQLQATLYLTCSQRHILMVEKEIPAELLERMDYSQFLEECKRVSELSDEDVKESFKESQSAPEEVRAKYKKLADMVTAYDYDMQRKKHAIESLKTEGNNLFREAKYPESLEKYEEALEKIRKMKKHNLQETERSLILNVALAHIKMNQPAKAVAECEKVFPRTKE